MTSKVINLRAHITVLFGILRFNVLSAILRDKLLLKTRTLPIRALGGAAAGGLYAEYTVIDETALVAVPAHLSDEEAETLPRAALTA